MNIALTMVFISSFVTLGGIGFGLYQHTWLQKASITSGEVIKLIEKRDSHGDRTYAPSVRFTDPTGKIVVFTSSSSSNPPEFTIGQTVRVASSVDGSKTSILTFGQCYGISAVAMAFGIAGLLVGLAFMAGPKIIDTLYLSK